VGITQSVVCMEINSRAVDHSLMIWYNACMNIKEIEIYKDKIASIARKHSLTLVVLFGSQATGLTHKNSDIDVGYLSTGVLDYRAHYEITEALMQIFRNKDVELVNLENISPDTNKQVADDGVVLFETEKGIFDRFVISAYRRYMETKPLREYRYQYVKRFLNAYA